MRLSDLSIARPVLAWVIMFALIVFGAVSLTRLGVSYMPDVDFPILSVRVSWEGAAPEIMEAEIVDRMERRLITVEGLREMVSSVGQGSASINLEFDIERNVDAALQEVQTAIGRLELPVGVEPPIVLKSNPEESPIMWLGFFASEGQLDEHELFVLADQGIIDRLQLLPGVGEVFMGGNMERNLRVWADNNKLRQYELSILDVEQALELEHREAAAGYLENTVQERNLRVLGEAPSVEDIRNIRITRRGGAPIYGSDIRIRDVARVEDGLNDHRRITRVDGGAGLSIGIRKQIGANTVAVGERVQAEVAAIQETLPEGITLQVNFDSTRFVKEAIDETQFTLLLSGILTAIVCWLFLGSFNSTLNVVLSIPTSVIGTFLILYFLDFTLNLFTLLGLSLAIGIVVDDNIMVLENIVRHFDMGKDRVRAARDGTREIFFAALASSTAIAAIFLPVAFMEGVIGKFFFEFGVTITAAVALSLLDAVTLTPMRASRLLVREERTPRIVRITQAATGALTALYSALLAIALEHRWKVMLGAAVAFSASMGLFFLLRSEFVPTQDQSQFGARLLTPTGSSLTQTSERMRSFEDWLMQQPEYSKYVSIAGGFGGGESSSGFVFITMVPLQERDVRQEEFMQRAREAIASIDGLSGNLFDFSSRGLTARRSSPIDFTIRGPEWSVLRESSDQIERLMSDSPYFVDVESDYRAGTPESRVVPIREAAAQRGVSMDSLVRTVASGMGGVRSGRFTNDGRRYDIRLRLVPEQWRGPADLLQLQVRNNYGELIPLGDVARVESNAVVQNLTRVDRQRAISLNSNVAAGVSQVEAFAEAERLARSVLPDGYSFHAGGGSRGLAETFESLYFAMWLGILAAYFVLAAQFNSFIHPIAVLLALPFSVSGAFLALFVTGQSINLYSLIGVILLMGIAKKNSILLVEFANESRRRGHNIQDALMEAARVRFRPIFMTSLTAIAAAIPPALALGPGAESRIPMAITVIGGMLFSTALTLFVTPCAYSLLARLERSNTGGMARRN